jgi:hypothetical protein
MYEYWEISQKQEVETRRAASLHEDAARTGFTFLTFSITY